MNQRTLHVSLNTDRDAAFDFLSDLENLPAWAVNFCRELKRDGDGYRVVTREGEIRFRAAADPATGVIDFVGGPAPDRMALFPTRVVALPEDRSLYLFTLVQTPGTGDREFAAMCDSLREELEVLGSLLDARRSA